MKHNVNFGLLGLLLLVIVAMIGLVLYYYTTYEGLSRKYDEALLSLRNVSGKVNQTQYELAAREAQLREKEKMLIDYLGELNISRQRETSLGGHYNEMKDKVENLSSTLNLTVVERNKYAAQADKYYAESLEWKGKYDREHENLNSANNRITKMRGDAAELEKTIESFDNELASLENSIKNTKGYAEDIKRNLTDTSTVNRRASDIKAEVNSMETTVTALQSQLTQIMTRINSLKGA